MPRARRQYRGAAISRTLPPRMAVECPDCGAQRGNRCFRLSSWVVPRVPLRGFYTERMDGFHPGRRAPVSVEVGQDPRGQLRKQIGALVMRKLSGNERVGVRRWAGSTQRVEQELAAKLAELEAMPDLTW